MSDHQYSQHGSIAYPQFVANLSNSGLDITERNTEMFGYLWILVTINYPLYYIPLARREFGFEAHGYCQLAPHAAVWVPEVAPGNGATGVGPTVSLMIAAFSPVEFALLIV